MLLYQLYKNIPRHQIGKIQAFYLTNDTEIDDNEPKDDRNIEDVTSVKPEDSDDKTKWTDENMEQRERENDEEDREHQSKAKSYSSESSRNI